jgi:hypothetical protein
MDMADVLVDPADVDEMLSADGDMLPALTEAP